MRWVGMTVSDLDPHFSSIGMTGDGDEAPAYASVTGALLENISIGDSIEVEIDSDDYPVNVSHKGRHVWPTSPIRKKKLAYTDYLPWPPIQ